MDPTKNPNFIPPSLDENIEPPADASQIPRNVPIQPYFLFGVGFEEDCVTPPQKSTCSVEDMRGKLLCESHIPSKYGRLQGPGCDDDYANPETKLPEGLENEKGRSSLISPTVTVRSSQIADLEEVPQGVQRQARNLEEYKFPTHRLATTMADDTKYPLVIVACGSFSPITYLHLRMFEMALDSINEQTRFEVIGGYYSPVSSNYKKQGLAPAHHRVSMCELACERTSSWLMVDAWESLQPKYTRTALVLDHFNHEINLRRGGVATNNGERKGVKIMLLAGGDLIESMGEPDVWADQDIHHILGKYGSIIIERAGADVRSFLLSHDIMYEHRRNVLLIKQLIYNDISSTKIRLFIRRGMSVQYLLPNSVINYIQRHKLYVNDTEPVKQVLNDKAE